MTSVRSRSVPRCSASPSAGGGHTAGSSAGRRDRPGAARPPTARSARRACGVRSSFKLTWNSVWPCAKKLGKGESPQNVKPFIETLRVTNPVRQSRASSRKQVLRRGGRPSPRSVDSEIKRCVIEPRNFLVVSLRLGQSRGPRQALATLGPPIPCAAMSETSSNWWKIRVIHEAGCWKYFLGRASRTSGMAAWKSRTIGGNDRQRQGFWAICSWKTYSGGCFRASGRLSQEAYVESKSTTNSAMQCRTWAYGVAN